MAPEKEACSLERVEGERAKERGEGAKQCEGGHTTPPHCTGWNDKMCEAPRISKKGTYQL